MSLNLNIPKLDYFRHKFEEINNKFAEVERKIADGNKKSEFVKAGLNKIDKSIHAELQEIKQTLDELKKDTKMMKEIFNDLNQINEMIKSTQEVKDLLKQLNASLPGKRKARFTL